MPNTHEVHIRRGKLVNDDPQKRCYNGCYYYYYKSHIEWDEWKLWMDYPSEDHAKHAVELFQREIQELKVVPKSLRKIKQCSTSYVVEA